MIEKEKGNLTTPLVSEHDAPTVASGGFGSSGSAQGETRLSKQPIDGTNISQKLGSISIPVHVEVTFRICISLIFIYILTMGSFPNVVPPSQRVLIASLASAFTMVAPTLLFSIGAVILPGMVGASFIALVVATGLLAVAATGGVNAYIVVYFFVALILSGLRFTDQGNSTAVLIMLISLNTMSLQAPAAEEGLSFVASLWTESGTTNPNAAFRNTLIGMGWVSICITFSRVIPPWRTARSAFSRKLLPKVLKDVAAFMRLIVAHHIMNETNHDVRDFESDAGPSEGGNSTDQTMENIQDAMIKVVQDGTITIAGGMSGVTAFEPRLKRLFCHCSPMYEIVTMLNELTSAVNELIFSSLTLRLFDKAGFEELQAGGLQEVYEEAAVTLDRCAIALATLKPTRLVGYREVDPESTPPVVFDPVRLHTRASRVEALTNAWVGAMGPIDRSKARESAEIKQIFNMLKPWVMAAGFGLVFAIFGCIRKVITPSAWRRIFLPPYYDLPKFIWCFKFAIGFTALVCMQVYWPEFRTMEITTSDRNEGTSAHFAGWFLIAYAFGTTQTVEGTWKKSMLRILGTSAGGFSAWLALTAFNNNPIGLGVWMTVTNTLAAIFGLPKGFRSYFGLDSDFAWGPGYFSMTQSLVVLEVYLGFGGKNDITVNRIGANLAGIGMSMLMAAIPPGVWGSSPREAKFLLEDKKRAFRDCIELMLDASDATKLNHLYATAEKTFIAGFSEANSNYIDANTLQRLCILKPNPNMGLELSHMSVLGSSILALLRFSVVVLEAEPEKDDRFKGGCEDRDILETILGGLDIEGDIHDTSSYRMNHEKGKGKDHARPRTPLCESPDQARFSVPAHTTFAHFSIFVYEYIINWGFVGEKHARKGRRTKSLLMPRQVEAHQN